MGNGRGEGVKNRCLPAGRLRIITPLGGDASTLVASPAVSHSLDSIPLFDVFSCFVSGLEFFQKLSDNQLRKPHKSPPRYWRHGEPKDEMPLPSELVFLCHDDRPSVVIVGEWCWSPLPAGHKATTAAS